MDPDNKPLLRSRILSQDLFGPTNAPFENFNHPVVYDPAADAFLQAPKVPFENFNHPVV